MFPNLRFAATGVCTLFPSLEHCVFSCSWSARCCIDNSTCPLISGHTQHLRGGRGNKKGGGCNYNASAAVSTCSDSCFTASPPEEGKFEILRGRGNKKGGGCNYNASAAVSTCSGSCFTASPPEEGKFEILRDRKIQNLFQKLEIGTITLGDYLNAIKHHTGLFIFVT